MEAPEIARLQNYIARLNSIIDALVTENKLLKQLIAHHNLDIGKTESFFADDNSEVGKQEFLKPVPHFQVGKQDNFIANHNFDVGNTESFIADDNFLVGKQEFLKPDAHLHVGKTDNFIAHPENRVPSAEHFGMLANSLRKAAMKNTIKQGRIHAAKLLLHFYEQKPGDYPSLVKLTGLSYYGLGKMIASMKKRGWLVRSGRQQFILTDVAKKMVEEGCGIA
jgi:hypothetical protein